MSFLQPIEEMGVIFDIGIGLELFCCENCSGIGTDMFVGTKLSSPNSTTTGATLAISCSTKTTKFHGGVLTVCLNGYVPRHHCGGKTRPTNIFKTSQRRVPHRASPPLSTLCPAQRRPNVEVNQFIQNCCRLLVPFC